MEGGLDKKHGPSEGRVEVEDGKLDFEELSDGTEVELILSVRVRMSAARRGRISEMFRKHRALSRKTGLKWRLCMGLGRNGTGRDDPPGYLRNLGVWKHRPQEERLTKMWKCEGLQLHRCHCIGRTCKRRKG